MGGKRGLLCAVTGVDEDCIPAKEEGAGLVLVIGDVEALSSVGGQNGGGLLVRLFTWDVFCVTGGRFVDFTRSKAKMALFC